MWGDPLILKTSKTVSGRQVHVSRTNIAQAMLVDRAESTLSPASGQTLFRVRRFALTANNVTYAAAGDRMNYWDFFPAPEGQGIVPVWGFAECVESEADGVKRGERFWGYWPMAEMLLVEVGRIDKEGFSDVAPHRRERAPIYNRYDRADRDTDAARERLTAIYRPLFTTGWLIERQMAAAQDYGARQIVFSSASSKTAISAVWNFAQREGERPELIGLTSPANLSFCEALGIYDRVLAYDDLAAIAKRPADRLRRFCRQPAAAPLRARTVRSAPRPFDDGGPHPLDRSGRRHGRPAARTETVLRPRCGGYGARPSRRG